MKKQIQDLQERLRKIDSLTNTLAVESELTATEKSDVAYMIHELCNGLELSSDTYRRIASYQIASKASEFISHN